MKTTVHRPFSRRGENGVALLLALVAILFLTIVGIALTVVTSTERDIASNESYVNKAFYGADSGIQYAAAQLKATAAFGAPSFTGLEQITNLPVNSPNMGDSSGNMRVSVTAPVKIAQSPLIGYKFGEWWEYDYAMGSTAVIANPANAQDQANKTIFAQVGVQPVQAN
jgi:PilX N-terminal